MHTSKSQVLLNDRLKVTSELDGQKTLLLYAAVLDVLEAFSKGSSVDLCMKLLTRRIEDLSENMYCSIMLLNSESGCFEKIYAPSLPNNYCSVLQGLSIGPNVGSCGTAAFFAKRVVVSDTFSDSLWKNYVELAKKYSLRACWSEPIISKSNEVLGTFAMYYKEVRNPSSYDLEIISEAAHIASVLCSRQKLEKDLFNKKNNINKLKKLHKFVNRAELITNKLQLGITNLGGQLHLLDSCNLASDDAKKVFSKAKKTCKQLVNLLSKLSVFTIKKENEEVKSNNLKASKVKPLLVIIDDEEQLVSLGEQFAELYGIDVCGFTDPLEAISWFYSNSEKVNSVLLDVTMPGLDGIDCYYQFKKIKNDIPYYIYSGQAPNSRTAKLICLNEIKFFQKPLDYKLFFSNLVKKLKTHKENNSTKLIYSE